MSTIGHACCSLSDVNGRPNLDCSAPPKNSHNLTARSIDQYYPKFDWDLLIKQIAPNAQIPSGFRPVMIRSQEDFSCRLEAFKQRIKKEERGKFICIFPTYVCTFVVEMYYGMRDERPLIPVTDREICFYVGKLDSQPSNRWGAFGSHGSRCPSEPVLPLAESKSYLRDAYDRRLQEPEEECSLSDVESDDESWGSVNITQDPDNPPIYDPSAHDDYFFIKTLPSIQKLRELYTILDYKIDENHPCWQDVISTVPDLFCLIKKSTTSGYYDEEAMTTFLPTGSLASQFESETASQRLARSQERLLKAMGNPPLLENSNSSGILSELAEIIQYCRNWIRV